MNKILVVAVVAAIAVVGIYILLGASKNGAQNSMSEQAATPTVEKTDKSKMEQAKNTITLTSQGFSPSTLTVSKGAKVVWVNNSGSTASINSNPHPTHTDYPLLNLGQVTDGESVELTFPKSGTYGYHNHLNPTETGTVIVE